MTFLSNDFEHTGHYPTAMPYGSQNQADYRVHVFPPLEKTNTLGLTDLL